MCFLGKIEWDMGDEQENRDTGYEGQNERDMGYEGACVTPPPIKGYEILPRLTEQKVLIRSMKSRISFLFVPVQYVVLKKRELRNPKSQVETGCERKITC